MRDAKAAAVLHFAANALVGESMTNPAKYFRNNVCNGLNLLEAALAAGVKKFVFSSTCATYGPPERVPMTEDLPQRPINPYGESKLMFERMLYWFGQIHGLEYVALRYFNAAGASAQFGEASPLGNAFDSQRAKGGAGPVGQLRGLWHGLSDAGRDVHPRLHSHCGFGAGAHPGAGAGEKRLLQSGQRRRLLGEASHCRRARKITHQPISFVEKPRRAGDPPRLVASAEKAIRELGWKPQFPKLEQIITDAWRWHVAPIRTGSGISARRYPRLFEQSSEARLLEVMIAGEGLRDPLVAHYDKGDAVGQTANLCRDGKHRD